MKNNSFVPQELIALPGTGITWINDDDRCPFAEDERTPMAGLIPEIFCRVHNGVTHLVKKRALLT